MLAASADFPIEGRAAMMIRSDGCRPPSLLVEVDQAGGKPGQRAVAAVRLGRHLHGAGEEVLEGLEALIDARFSPRP
jgi:hypothetical protein